MPINVSDAQANYTSSAPLAASKYKKKVSVNTTWNAHASSDAAESLWSQKVADAAARRARARGVQAIPQSEWVAAASGPGAANLPSGMTNHASKWAKNFGPYAPVIDAAVSSLPPRGMGIDANIERVRLIGKALEDAKRAQG